MSAKPLTVLLLLGVLIGVVAIFLVTGEEAESPEPEDSSGSPTVLEPSSIELDVDGAVGSETIDRREVVAGEPEKSDDTGGMPESYRRALGVLTGRLVEADGTPAVDFQLELLAVRLQELLVDIPSMFSGPAISVKTRKGATRTDEEGRFRFEGIFNDSIHVLGIDPGGARAAARFVDHVPNPGMTVDLGDVVLEPYVVITGRVVNLDDAPLAGVRVRATNLPALLFRFGAAELRADSSLAHQTWRDKSWQMFDVPQWGSDLIEDLPIPQTRTMADGTFLLEAVPVGLATIVVDSEGFVTNVHGPVPTGASGGQRDVGTIRMDEGDELVGRVVDVSGKPVAGVEVKAGPMIPMAELSLLRPVGITGVAGAFRAGGFSDDQHLVAVRPEGGLDWKVTDGVQPGMNELVIQLDPSHDLEVVAVDPSGAVVRNPELILRLGVDPAEIPVVVPPVRLGERVVHREDGSVLVENLGARNYDLFVRAEGFAVERQEVDLTHGAQELRVELKPAHTVSLRVVDSESGEAVEWVTAAALMNGAWERWTPVPSATAKTGRDGSCELTGLGEGTWTIRAMHPDYATMEVEMQVPGDPLDIALRRGGSIVGRVHAGGRPPDEPRFIVVNVSGSDLLRMVVTDFDGRFSVANLGAGRHRLEVFRRFAHRPPADVIGDAIRNVEPERRVRVSVDLEEEVQVDIDLLGSEGKGPRAMLRGKLILNDQPQAGRTIVYSPRGNWGHRKSTLTDEAGVFDFGQVPAGQGSVRIDSAPDDRDLSTQGGRQTMSLTLLENEVRDLLIEIRTGRLRGRVLADIDGRAVYGADVRLHSAEPAGEGADMSVSSSMRTTSEEDGTFQFDGMPEGLYRITISADGFAKDVTWPQEVRFHGEAPPVEIRLHQGVIVAGTIRFPDGSDVGYAYIYLRRKDSEFISHRPRVDPTTGQFRIEKVAPGSYTLHIWTNRGGCQPIELEVPPGGLEDLAVQAEWHEKVAPEGG